jgi:predicted ATP-grasp superfamily ATP-dependent carboligase
MAARSGAAPSHALDGHHYFQRELPGTPCSATFVANGTDAAVIGFNQMIVRRFGAWPFVFCGALGPVRLDPQVTAEVTAVVRALASEFSLRGLGSLDFMLDGESFGVLELNPRPPASIALYGREHFPAAPRGVLAAHVRACIEGELPCWPAHAGNHLVRGIEIVYAARVMICRPPQRASKPVIRCAVSAPAARTPRRSASCWPVPAKRCMILWRLSHDRP